ncbi:MAG: DnaD domain protein [Tenericutes bacterium]|nr:DnaD domain protein [Mycoplasmatota bacterium]
MNNKFNNIIKSKYITIPIFLYSICKDLSVSGDEFILLMYLNNKGEQFVFDPNLIEKDLNIKLPLLMEYIDNFINKGLIELKNINSDKNILQEYIILTPFYEKIKLKIMNNNEDEESLSIYQTIEKEFGRPLSPMEYEIIKAWIDDYSNEELVLEALKEAVYNGVYNLRYIDVILNEWRKKGYKTASDIIKRKPNQKSELKEVFDYDWLNEDDE